MLLLKSRALRWLSWGLLALLLLVLLAWLALPPLLKWQLETRGSQLLGRELRVGEIKFSPLTLALTLNELSIGAAPGAAQTSPQLQLQRLFVDLDARTLLRFAPVVEALEIDKPQLRIARVAAGRYDIDDLLQRFDKPPQPDADPARFALYNLRLSGGEITLDDRPVARRHELRNLELALPFLSNLPDHLQIKVEPHLAFALNGSEFESRGRSTPFAEGRASAFDIRFDGLDLGHWWAYVPKGQPLQPVGGKLWADLNLAFEQPRESGPRVELRGSMDLRDFALHTPANAPVLSWQSLRLRLGDVRPLQRRVGLESLHVDGAVLHVRRDGGGRLELQELAAAPAAPAAASASASAPAPASAAPASVAAARGASAAASGAAAASAEPATGWQLQLALLELNAAQVNWSDATVQPAAEVQLDGIGLRMKSLRWPVEGDAALQLAAQLKAAGQPAGQLRAEGTLTDRQAKIAFHASDVELAAASPYLGQRLRPQLAARLGADGELDWAGGGTPRLLLALAKLSVDDFKLADKAAAPPRPRAKAAPTALAQWQRLELSNARVDLLQRRVGIGMLSLQQPFIDLARDAAGTLNASTWMIEGEPAAAAPAAAEAAPPWTLSLRELQVEAGSARFADAALPAGPLQLGGVRLKAQGLAWPLAAGAAPMDTQLAANLSVAGQRAAGSAAAAVSRLDWRGRVSAQPLGANGQLRLERFPVHVFEPYFGARLPVVLRRLEAGVRGQVEVQHLAQGLSARLRGDALLADLRIVARDAAAAAPGAAASESELLTWSAMAFSGIDAALQPGTRPRVEIGELRVSDYYSRLEVTEDGRFNLQTVAAAPPGGAAAGAKASPAAAVAAASAPPAGGAAAPAPATAGTEVSAPVTMLSGLPVDLLIGSTQFSNGRVDFNDRFVRPNYSAQLTELNGRIGRLDSRSRDMATLQFNGRIAGTGLLEIGGAVNPTVIPPALDIRAKAQDIELSGLTPYSSKYAGYPIERGRLSVEVAYKVDADGRLEANNQIIVHQLTFGAKTDSPNATKLPVPLIVALLQDKHGVIDLDIPLTGSLNDPQFSLGALVWKVIVNLFNKIVSSPFSVVGGGGKDLSRVDFRPGTAQITDGGQEVIAKVAKALDDRPGLKLGIVASADPVSERQAMQQAAFEARVLAEQRRERARGSLGAAAAADAAPLPPLSAAERAELVKQIYADTRLPDKPRNLVGMAKGIPVAEMEAMLVAAMPVDESAARQLAVQRGRSVREALLAKGLSGERLSVGEAKLRSEAADNAPWVPQAQLTLSAQ